jgi:hypothetical protein
MAHWKRAQNSLFLNLSAIIQCYIINKALSDYQPCQFVKTANFSGTISVTIIRAMMMGTEVAP